MSDDASFATSVPDPGALRLYVVEAGILDVLEQPVAALEHRLAATERLRLAPLRRWTLAQLFGIGEHAGAELEASGGFADALRVVAWRYLRELADRRQAALREEQEIVRTGPRLGSDPRIWRAHQIIRAARQIIRRTALPRCREEIGAHHFDLYVGDPPTARYTEMHAVVRPDGRRVPLAVELVLSSEDPDALAASAECSCGASTPSRCTHVLAAFDALSARVLEAPKGAAMLSVLERFVRPSAPRLLDKLDEFLSAEGERRRRGRAGLVWRLLRTESGPWTLETCLEGRGSRGVLERLSWPAVFGAIDAWGGPGEQDALAILRADIEAQSYGRAPAFWPTPSAVHRALLRLVGHPAVFVILSDEEPGIRVRLERLELALAVEAGLDGRIRFFGILGDERMPLRSLAQRLIGGLAGQTWVDVDAERGICRVTPLNDCVADLIRALQNESALHPGDARALLECRIEELAGWLPIRWYVAGRDT